MSAKTKTAVFWAVLITAGVVFWLLSGRSAPRRVHHDPGDFLSMGIGFAIFYVPFCIFSKRTGRDKLATGLMVVTLSFTMWVLQWAGAGGLLAAAVAGLLGTLIYFMVMGREALVRHR